VGFAATSLITTNLRRLRFVALHPAAPRGFDKDGIQTKKQRAGEGTDPVESTIALRS
jgi:hypothetical protein